MSENPLYYSGNQTSKSSNLKPALSAALASLEVQLDEELVRYRRTRIANRTPIQKSLGSLIAAKPQSQSAVAVVNSQNQQNLTGEQAAAYIKQQQSNTSLPTPPPPPPPPVREASPGANFNREKNSEIPQPVNSIQEETLSFSEANTKTQNTSLPNQSSIVKAGINQNTSHENISAPKNDHTKQPDDYLESSEALLRSLQQEEQQPPIKKPKKNNDSLLSPLSIGSMLLLLVSSITFGYIIFNFNNPSSWNLGGLFNRNQKVSSEDSENVSDVKSSPQKLTAIPKNPNLASDALPDIKSIDDVAGATPRAKPTSAAKPPRQPIAQAPIDRRTGTVGQMPSAVENVPAKTVSETEAVPVPAPQTKVAPTPQNIDEIEPSNGEYYNVIVDNAGDTLTEVKKIIPDAYLSPEGKYVYLGAFKSKERLKKHLELLQEKGISARVEQPDS